MHFRTALITLMMFAGAAFAHGPSEAPHQTFPLGDFKWESGEAIRDFSISYVTHGTLNANQTNAILARRGSRPGRPLRR